VLCFLLPEVVLLEKLGRNEVLHRGSQCFAETLVGVLADSDPVFVPDQPLRFNPSHNSDGF
jgi:hypothetical protein